MKNWFILFVLFIGLNTYAQERNNELLMDEPSITCDVVKFDTDKNTMEFQGNVNFKSNIINLEDAENLVLDRSTNEIVVTGLNGFTMIGTIHIKDKAEMKILKYTLGDRIAYLE